MKILFRQVVFVIVALVFSLIALIVLLKGAPKTSINVNGIYVQYSHNNLSLNNYAFAKYLMNLTKPYEIINYSGTNSSAKVKNIIENYDITTLPSFVIVNASASNFSLLPYFFLVNAFNFITINGTTSAILNTPYLSTITGNASFYSILYNKTIFDKYVSNPSIIYNNIANASSIAYLFVFIETNQTPSKTIYITLGNDSYSALGLDLFDIALSNFGNVTGKFFQSSSLPLGNITLGPIQYLYPSSFSSKYFNLQTDEISNIGSNSSVLDAMLTYDINGLNPIYGSMGFLPFIDIGNKFIGFSSPLRPNYFNNYNYSSLELLYRSKENSTLAIAVKDTINFYNAMLCNLINSSKPSICYDPEVKQYSSLVS